MDQLSPFLERMLQHAWHATGRAIPVFCSDMHVAIVQSSIGQGESLFEVIVPAFSSQRSTCLQIHAH